MTTYEVLATPSASGISLFGADVLQGLSKRKKQIPARYFYDDRGSELFDQITRLPEYYPTRAETSILSANADLICELVGTEPTDIVELGCGCGPKTWDLLGALLSNGADIRYRPIDISEGAMSTLYTELDRRFGSRLEVEGVVAEYNGGLAHLNAQSTKKGRKKLILFFGANIGNMTDPEAVQFLRELGEYMQPEDRLLIGFDLKKDLHILQQAYDDSQGITAEFNLNLLARMNRELGADFDLTNFTHHAFYDPAREAMVSWIISLEAQQVRFKGMIGNPTFIFRELEGIWVEMSRKFSTDDISVLAQRSDLIVENWLLDSQQMFVNTILRRA